MFSNNPPLLSQKKESKTLMEVSNILANAFLTPMSTSQGENWILSVPEAKIDNLRGLLTWALRSLKKPESTVAAAYVRMELPQHKTYCTIVIFLNDVLLTRFKG